MNRRLPYLDILKALGMALIVLGHVDAGRFDHTTPPIHFKQLGVACFVVVAGFGLARERRGTLAALYRRLFDLLLFGLGCALLLNVLSWFQTGDLRESDLLPFLLGANVVAMNAFPANPTTWFLGTYTHVMLLWAIVLRGVTIRPWMLAASLVVEIAARAWLISHAGLFIAYMALPNWITLFLLGLYLGQRTPATDDRERDPPGWRPWRDAAVLAALVGLWPVLSRPWFPTPSFPFQGVDPTGKLTAWGPWLISLAVSAVYHSYTLGIYRVVRWLPGSSVSRFFARNTVIIFLAHMPVRYGLLDSTLPGPSLPAIAGRFLVCYVLLALVSEGIVRVVHPERLRARLGRALGALDAPAPETAPPILSGMDARS